MKGMHDGTLVVTEDGKVSGMVTGDMVVEPGAFAKVSGMVTGRVTGDAVVTGMVGG